MFPVFIFFGLRFLVLWTGLEMTCHYDELDLGTMAKEVLEGLKLPYREYQLDAYSGESLVLGALTVPFFKGLGMNLMALKMVPLMFSFLTLAVSYFFLRRHFSEKAARMGAWLLVLCPQSFVQLSLVGMSGHTEALLWSVAALFAFYEFLSGKDTSSVILRTGRSERSQRSFASLRMTWLFVFGLSSGFGFWFYYANGIMTAVCLLAWLVRDRKSFFSTKLGLFAVFFLIGFSPWLMGGIHNAEGGTSFFAAHFNPSDFAFRLMHGIPKILKLIFAGIPASFVMHGAFGIPERILSYAHWFLCFLPAALWGIKTMVKDKKILPLAFYPVLFSVIFGAVLFDLQPEFSFVGYRYLTPVLFWSLLLFAVMASRTGTLGKGLWMGTLALGFVGQAALMFQEPAGRALHYKGYSYHQLGIRLGIRPERPAQKGLSGFEDLQKRAQSWSPAERYFFYWGLSTAGVLIEGPRVYRGQISIEDFFKRDLEATHPFLREWEGGASTAGTIEEKVKESASVPEPFQKYFFKGWLDGWWQIDSIQNCPHCPGVLDPESRVWVYRGFGKYAHSALLENLYTEYWRDPFYLFLNDVKPADLDKLFQMLRPFGKEERAWIYQGTGRGRLIEAFYSNLLTTRPFETFLRAAPPENRRDIFWGMGWGVREMFREDSTRALDWIQRLPPEGQGPALEGMREFEKWYRVPGS